MLISLYGYFVMASAIASLQPYSSNGCKVVTYSDSHLYFEDRKCIQIVEEINRQLKEEK